MLEPVDTGTSLKYDLTTEAGLLACITESLLPIHRKSYEDSEYLMMTVIAIATKMGGAKLERPITIVLMSAGEDIPTFLATAYNYALREYQAAGTLTIGATWAAEFESPLDMHSWDGRSLEDHPRAYRSLVAFLEHRVWGVRSWESRISLQNGKPTAAPFECLDMRRPDGGFLDLLRSLS